MDPIGPQRGLLGQRSAANAHHSVTDGQVVDLATDLPHPAHHLGTRRPRQFRFHLVEAPSHEAVHERQPDGFDVHHDLARIGCWRGDFFLLEQFDGVPQFVLAPNPHQFASPSLLAAAGRSTTDLMLSKARCLNSWTEPTLPARAWYSDMVRMTLRVPMASMPR